MTIAEKLIQIAENEQKVFDAGYKDGKKAEWDAFWDSAQDFGNRRVYAGLFASDIWNSTTFSPKYDIITEASPLQMFYECGAIGDLSAILKRNGVVLDLSNATVLSCTFYLSKITKIPVLNVSQCTKFLSTFGSDYLKEIEALHGILETATFNPATFNCIELETIGEITGKIGQTISFKSCEKLGVNTAKRVILALKNYAGTDLEGVCTVSFHSSVWANLEESGSAPDGGTWADYVIYTLGWNI